uniref:Uncharacterized protein n=1 Tax=Rhizophagus irregularis (strain DAOM 181602 / DAOM 197198 / MUCL 43194) TaxID=747089 RepID=U9SVC3_RHIID
MIITIELSHYFDILKSPNATKQAYVIEKLKGYKLASLEKEIDLRHLPTAYGISRLPQLGLCDNCRLQMNKNMVWCLLAAMVTIQFVIAYIARIFIRMREGISDETINEQADVSAMLATAISDINYWFINLREKANEWESLKELAKTYTETDIKELRSLMVISTGGKEIFISYVEKNRTGILCSPPSSGKNTLGEYFRDYHNDIYIILAGMICEGEETKRNEFDAFWMCKKVKIFSQILDVMILFLGMYHPTLVDNPTPAEFAHALGLNDTLVMNFVQKYGYVIMQELRQRRKFYSLSPNQVYEVV